MRLPDVLAFAGTQLRRNKGRSFLTGLGVAVGVFALTTIAALGRGLETAVTGQLSDDENQSRIVVRAGFGPLPDEAGPQVTDVADPVKADRLRKTIAKRRRGGPAQRRRMLITPEVLADLRARPHVTSVRPFVIDRYQLTLGEHREEGAIAYAVAPGEERWSSRVIAGRPFGPDRGVWLHEYLLYRWGYRSDAEQAALVGQKVHLSRPREARAASALLETARARGLELPPGVDPTLAERLVKSFLGGAGGAGQAPELDLELEILGVVRERIEADGFELWEDSFSMQSDLFLPQALAEELFLQAPANAAGGFPAAAVDLERPANVPALEGELRREGYQTISVGTVLERVGQALAVMTVFVSGLVAVALLVAVLGITNTMIMNVSERTREIGVLKALGARDRQVKSLFVAESALIGLGGGAVGVAGSLLASIPGDWITRWAIRRSTEYGFDGTVFSFSPLTILVALGGAVLLSVLAAWFPATRASRVDPVVALRDE